MSNTATKKKDLSKSRFTDAFTLILWNDDVNTFDDVIEALVEICGHDELQAEQCATITHFKGKCAVKTGEPFAKLYRMKRQFDARKINTSIE